MRSETCIAVRIRKSLQEFVSFAPLAPNSRPRARATATLFRTHSNGNNIELPPLSARSAHVRRCVKSNSQFFPRSRRLFTSFSFLLLHLHRNSFLPPAAKTRDEYSETAVPCFVLFLQQPDRLVGVNHKPRRRAGESMARHSRRLNNTTIGFGRIRSPNVGAAAVAPRTWAANLHNG